MLVNISYIKLDNNITDNYERSLTGWQSKLVDFNKLTNYMCDSKIQYSAAEYTNGIKQGKDWNNDKQSLLIIDVDDGLTIEGFSNMFRDYHWVLATTKSHQKTKKGKILDRYRVCLLATNIPKDRRKYLKVLELLFPFSDEQTFTLTAAFLGNDNSEVLFNKGKLLDCTKATQKATELIAEEDIEIAKEKANRLPVELRGYSYGNKLDAKTIKEQLTLEIMFTIAEDLGYEVVKGKIRLREDESTASAKLYPNGFIKDYGGDFSGDIFKLLQEERDLSFVDAMRYVNNYI